MSPIHILLVEDNEGDIVLTLEALRETAANTTISITRDGEQAIDYLKREGNYKQSIRPELILLDINLPRVDGKEVLHFIKTNEVLKSIPVVILTTSTLETDITDAYMNHANCYISKPADLHNFFDVIKTIENFWLSLVHLPKTTAHAS